MGVITSFRGSHRFLSNFYPSPINAMGSEFPTAEHLYQWCKVADVETANKILVAESPTEAKRLGKIGRSVINWHSLRLIVMTNVVSAKFAQNPKLADKLLNTGDDTLIEGNTWGDTFWGQCPLGVGENNLGRILMEVRNELKEQRDVHEKTN